MGHPDPDSLEVSLVDLGEKLCHWHMGQGDPIYAVGSFAFSGKVHPDRDVIERCLSNIEREQNRDGLTEADVLELLVHEFGHFYGSDHLSKEFHDGLCTVGAKLAMLALTNPSLFSTT